MFQSMTIIRSLHMSLAKVTFIKSVKVHHYGLCGCLAACCIKSMVVFVLWNSAQHTAHLSVNKRLDVGVCQLVGLNSDHINTSFA
jgi:hypothetical protein